MANPSRTDRVRSILIVLLIALVVAASLLAFPNALLWMVAFWLTIASVQIFRKCSGWLAPAICAVVFIVKRPDWSPASIAVGAMLVVAAFVLFWLPALTEAVGTRRKIAWIALGILWAVWLAAIWESYDGTHAERSVALDPHRPIVCLGDSLTTGLADNEAYPAYLQDLCSVTMLNLGRAGVTARDMTKHLPEILASRPQAVVIELGGHDFLRGYGRAATRESLVTIIETCQEAGAKVLLVEIPRGFIVDPFSGLERELAREYDLELVPDSAIRMLVVRSPAIPAVGNLTVPHLSDDGLHPNSAGARMLADTVFRSLRRIFGPSLNTKRRETLPAGSRPDRLR
jgi:lysophospholipase L1-like esterase